MPNHAAKTYIKHPVTQIGEVLCLASKYAHDALKTLAAGQVLDHELRQMVQDVIDKKFAEPEQEPFRQLIDLHFAKGKSMRTVCKMLNVSLPQAYDWRSEVELMVGDELFFKRLFTKKFKREILEILADDPEAVKAILDKTRC
jgi:hypothetical protein